MTQIALNALVAHYLDMGRGHELAILEKILKKPLDRKERVLIMIVFARARVAHSAFFGKRLGSERRSIDVNPNFCKAKGFKVKTKKSPQGEAQGQL